MRIDVYRFAEGDEDTLGILYIDHRFCCFTLEDQYQTHKVFGETRIPAGTYKVKLRKHGGMHERYSRRFRHIHEGMLEIMDVPEFTDILIHIGNRDDDTAGCLLVGNSVKSNKFEEGFLGESTRAYKHFYSIVCDAFENKQEVCIHIHDDLLITK